MLIELYIYLNIFVAKQYTYRPWDEIRVDRTIKSVGGAKNRNFRKKFLTSFLIVKKLSQNVFSIATL